MGPVVTMLPTAGDPKDVFPQWDSIGDRLYGLFFFFFRRLTCNWWTDLLVCVC